MIFLFSPYVLEHTQYIQRFIVYQINKMLYIGRESDNSTYS